MGIIFVCLNYKAMYTYSKGMRTNLLQKKWSYRYLMCQKSHKLELEASLETRKTCQIAFSGPPSPQEAVHSVSFSLVHTIEKLWWSTKFPAPSITLPSCRMKTCLSQAKPHLRDPLSWRQWVRGRVSLLILFSWSSRTPRTGISVHDTSLEFSNCVSFPDSCSKMEVFSKLSLFFLYPNVALTASCSSLSLSLFYPWLSGVF